MSDHLLEEREDGVVTLTMNRPDSLNALSGDMMEKLLEALPRLANDNDVGAIILRGAGRGFCAGGDVKGMVSTNTDSAGKSTPPNMEARARGLRASMEISRYLHECAKPTIAMIRGPAAGAGLSMALACDMRVASKESMFTTAFAKIGFSGDFGGTYFLTNLVGTAKARELYFTADKVKADEALSLGMINRLVEDESLEKETMALAQKIANGPRIANEYIKKNMNAAETSSLEQVFDLEAWNMTRTMFTEDHKEAAKAFVEKRSPVFKGQ